MNRRQLLTRIAGICCLPLVTAISWKRTIGTGYLKLDGLWRRDFCTQPLKHAIVMGGGVLDGPKIQLIRDLVDKAKKENEEYIDKLIEDELFKNGTSSAL